MEKNLNVEEIEKIRKEKLKALEATIGNIEKACGKGSIMRLGESSAEKVESVSTGSLGLDYALGVARGERAPIDGEFNGKTGTIEHSFISGTYSGNGDGYKGEINLNVTVSENKIEKIEYQGKETADIGGKAIEDIIATILRSQSTQVDSISGATFSSRGTQEALDYALGIARG